MHTRVVLLGTLSAWAVVLPALGQQGGALEACRKVSDPTMRLACYDALPLTLETPRAAPVSPGTRGIKRPEIPRVGEAMIESTVSSDFSGWGPNEEIALENGEVWQIVDGSTYATRPGKRKATVRLGVLGAHFLDIDGVARSPRVRRIK